MPRWCSSNNTDEASIMVRGARQGGRGPAQEMALQSRPVMSQQGHRGVLDPASVKEPRQQRGRVRRGSMVRADQHRRSAGWVGVRRGSMVRADSALADNGYLL